MYQSVAGETAELGVRIEPLREIALGLHTARVCRVAGIQDRPG